METTEWQREQWASTLEGNTEHDDEYVRHAIPRQKMAPSSRYCGHTQSSSASAAALPTA